MTEMIVSQKIIVYNNLVFSERVYVKPRRKKNGKHEISNQTENERT